jgi:hypothetical protein
VFARAVWSVTYQGVLLSLRDADTCPLFDVWPLNVAVEIECLIRSQGGTRLADFMPNLPLQTPTLPEARLYELITIFRPDTGMNRLYLLPVFVRGMDALLPVCNEPLREVFGHDLLLRSARELLNLSA